MTLLQQHMLALVVVGLPTLALGLFVGLTNIRRFLNRLSALYLISIAVKTGQAELWRALFAEMLQNHRAGKKNTSDEHTND